MAELLALLQERLPLAILLSAASAHLARALLTDRRRRLRAAATLPRPAATSPYRAPPPPLSCSSGFPDCPCDLPTSGHRLVRLLLALAALATTASALALTYQ